MMRKIRKLLLYLSLVFVVLFLLLALLANLFEEQIGHSLQAQINRQLETRLEFDGFGLSLLRHFPNLSADFHEVRVEDAFGDLLLESKRLSFLISPFSLFGKSIKVRSVALTDGALRIHYDRKGRPNYDIFSESETPDSTAPESEGVSLSIQSAQLRDVQLIYQDEASKTEAQIQLFSADIAGDFSAEEIALDTRAELQIQFLDAEDERYLPGTEIEIKGKTLLRPNEQYYAFDALEVSLEGNPFRLNGSLEMHETFSDYDLELSTEDAQLEGLLLFLPAKAFPALEGFKSRGDFQFHAAIKGRKTASSDPAITADFGLDHGRLSSELLTDDLKEVSFSGHFDNGKAHSSKTSRLTVKDLQAYLKREYIQADFALTNLDRPAIRLFLDGTLPIGSIYPALATSSISGGMGKITFDQVRIEGRIRDMQSADRMDRVKASGQILLDDAGLLVRGHKVFFDRGSFTIKGNEVAMKDMEIEAPGNEWSLEGHISNLLPALLAPAGNPYNARLKFSSALQADKLDLDKLLSITKEAPAETETGSDSLSANAEQDLSARGGSTDDSFFSMLDGSFEAKIAEFNYREIQAQNFKGKLEFFAGNVKIKGDVQAMDGRFHLNGTYFNLSEPYFKGQVICKGVDVKEFFRQNENFGQDILEDRHLSGKMNAWLSLTVPFDTAGNLLDDKLYVLAAVGIEEGELRDFEMLESFSTFVKIDDLRRIRFHNLYNYFEIRKRTIYIPGMFIQSNAMNMTLAGEYDFDYNYTFYLKVNAAQTLANRFKKHDPNLTPIPAKQNGWFNLYYKVYGNLDDYHYKTAKREVKQALAQSEHLKLLLKKRLRDEFGDIQLISEPDAWKDREEAEEYAPEEDEYLEGF